MAGYTRQAAANITTGSVIDADDFNDEYNQIQSAFNASTGHTHDGTAAEGAPITKVGPSQDLVITAAVVRPKTNNTLDLGTTSLNFKDAFFDGTVRTDILTVDETSTLTGNVSMGGTLAVTSNATVGGTLGVTGATTLANTSVGGSLSGTGGGTLAISSNATVGGTLGVTGNTTLDNATVGGTLGVTGNTTLGGTTTVQNLTVGGTFSGSVPASSLTGNLPANQITVITQNMDSDDVSEGSNNQYHTTARARSAISVGAGLSYNSSTGVITNTNPSAATVNNSTITIAAGSNLTGGGTFTTNQSGNSTITLNASAAASPNNPTITLAAGTSLTGGGTFTLNQSSNKTITFNYSAASQTAQSVGSLHVGVPATTNAGSATYSHSAGSNYAGSSIYGNLPGTWRCISPSTTTQQYVYSDNAYYNYTFFSGLYERIS